MPRLPKWWFLRNCNLLSWPKCWMIWRIDLYARFMEHPLLPGMILICGIVIPKRVIVRVDSLDTRLNDRVAASKARKLCYVNSRTFERATTDTRRIRYGVIFRMADDL